LAHQTGPTRSHDTVVEFRPFQNTDPPHLAEIWRSQPTQRGVMQPMSAMLLEQFLFSRPYFDPAGMIVAVRDDKPIAFVHAGFGPNDEGTALETDCGTTYLLMIENGTTDFALADDLLNQSEMYLRDRGATVLYGGGIRPLNGFYLGLYGGSELPGVLDTDPVQAEAFRRRGYHAIDRVVIMRRNLADFRAAVTRESRQLRRTVASGESYSPPSANWWEACTTGAFERIDFYAQSIDTTQVLGKVSFWDVEPLSSGWGIPTAGMFDLEIAPESRRKGIATFLLGEAFNRLKNRGIVNVEAQTMQGNTAALAMYSKLGFETTGYGEVFRKATDPFASQLTASVVGPLA
jgi:ribosomal protein S18 acetylase RimI-like enzyme